MRYLLVLIYWSLLIASFAIAYRNWQADPAQRTQAHLGTWLARVIIGTMWFEGCLWKLPIPSGGFRYWLEQEVQYAAFDFHKQFITSYSCRSSRRSTCLFSLPRSAWRRSFMLGLKVRAFALLGMVFTLQLYFGLYRHPNEWPWTYIFIIVICWMFYIDAAGRSLGLDALTPARDGAGARRRADRTPLPMGVLNREKIADAPDLQAARSDPR